jgi:hypothetical protein
VTLARNGREGGGNRGMRNKGGEERVGWVVGESNSPHPSLCTSHFFKKIIFIFNLLFLIVFFLVIVF